MKMSMMDVGPVGMCMGYRLVYVKMVMILFILVLVVLMGMVLVMPMGMGMGKPFMPMHVPMPFAKE